MKDGKHGDLVAKKITNDIDQHCSDNFDQQFSGSYTLHWNGSLNHWLVNYDVKRYGPKG
jgi:hypothetical protein